MASSYSPLAMWTLNSPLCIHTRTCTPGLPCSRFSRGILKRNVHGRLKLIKLNDVTG